MTAIHEEMLDARGAVQDAIDTLTAITRHHKGVDPLIWVQVRALCLALSRVADDIGTLAVEVTP